MTTNHNVGICHNNPQPSVWKRFCHHLKRLGVTGDVKVNKIMSAHDAYLKSKYGTASDDYQRIKQIINNIEATISNVITSQRCLGKTSYCCLIEIPDDLFNYEAKVVDVFRNKGYVVVSMSAHECNDSERHVYLISWNKHFKLEIK